MNPQNNDPSLLSQDIVTESNKFDLVAFVPLLRERIYSNNQYARQFIISWVSTTDCHVTLKLMSLMSRIRPVSILLQQYHYSSLFMN